MASQSSSPSSSYCEFCEILQDKKHMLIYQSAEIMAFDDIDKATSQRHILVCPTQHIPTSSHLQAKDIPLLQELQRIAELLLQKSHPNREYRFGYHIEPHISIDHLHLHGIALPVKDQFFNLVKFGRLLHPTDEIIESIHKKEKQA